MTKDIKKYEFKAGLPLEFEIIRMQNLFQAKKEMLVTTHRTGFYHILWFQQGNPTHLIDFNPVNVTPETILFVNKDTVQRFDNSGHFDGYIIIFTDSFFARSDADTKFLRSSILFNDLLAVSQIRLEDNSKLLLDTFSLMLEEIKQVNENYRPEILQNLLHNFLLLSERERRTQNFTEIKKGADLDYIMLFKDLLDKYFITQKQVGMYASQIGVTEKRLNQATSKILGKTPKEMIDDRVLLEAKRLLAHTNESVKEIGFSLGFEEPTNFIKYFRKHSQSTPIEFREQFSPA